MSIEIRNIPKNWSDIKGNETVVGRIQEMVEREKADPKNMMRNLFLIGAQGTGKSSTVNVIRREFKATTGDSFLELNMSDEGTMDVFRTTVKGFCTYTRMVGDYRKILVLEEFDNASAATQQAFRRIMETRVKNVLFILTGNREQKVIAPIRDRCFIGRYKFVKKEAIIERLKEVAAKEDIQYNDEDLLTIAEMSGGTVRSAVGMLGEYQMGSDIASIGSNLTAAASKFVALCVGSSYQKACDYAVDVVQNLDVPERDFLLKVRDIVVDSPDLNAATKRSLVILIADAEYRLVMGCHPKISIDWLVASVQERVQQQKRVEKNGEK